MGMTCLFLILSVFSVVVKSQLKPQVSMVPTFKLVYSGDTIILSCDNSTGQVNWFFNNSDQGQANKKIWSIGAVSAKNSGSYQCDDNGQKSDNFIITVLEYLPPATLSIKSGEPVINIDGSVVLELLVEDNSLMGWCCWVYKGGKVRRIKLKKSLTTVDHKVLTFQPYRLSYNIAIYWCSNENDLRSTPLTIKTSDQIVRMMILPGPALLGETLSLRCVVSGTTRISHTIIYKEEKAIQDSSSTSYVINKVTESDEGKYSCQATFTRSDRGQPNTANSTQQELIVSAPPMKAVLSVSAGMSCSCSSCPDGTSYHWYYKQNNHQWITQENRQSYVGDMSAGIYACRAVWKNGRSARSNSHRYDGHTPWITIVLIILGVVLVIVAVAIVMYLKRRTGEEAIYQDMPLRTVKSQDGGDGGYEELHKKHGTKREGEYDTLNTTPAEVAGGEKTEGAYEALKKGEGKEEDYHTLEEGAAKGGDGGYEALKKSKDGGTGDLYHTLGEKGAKGGEGGDGGYEALKKSKD